MTWLRMLPPPRMVARQECGCLGAEYGAVCESPSEEVHERLEIDAPGLRQDHGLRERGEGACDDHLVAQLGEHPRPERADVLDRLSDVLEHGVDARKSLALGADHDAE